MFPDDISTVVCFAIRNREWKTAKHFLPDLYGWMDSYDRQTGIAAANIANAIIDVVTEDKSKDLEIEILKLHVTWLKCAASLIDYAKESGVLEEVEAIA